MTKLLGSLAPSSFIRCTSFTGCSSGLVHFTENTQPGTATGWRRKLASNWIENTLNITHSGTWPHIPQSNSYRRGGVAIRNDGPSIIQLNPLLWNIQSDPSQLKLHVRLRTKFGTKLQKKQQMVVWRAALKGLVTYTSHVEMVVTGIKWNQLINTLFKS